MEEMEAGGGGDDEEEADDEGEVENSDGGSIGESLP